MEFIVIGLMAAIALGVVGYPLISGVRAADLPPPDDTDPQLEDLFLC